ncbi:MAG: FmdE family protein [Candidatus Bathyarchaeia archaeon]
MATSGQGQKQDLNEPLREAGKFHGHLGPFLAIGTRMGLIGIRELRTKKNKEGMRVTVMLKYSVPFSCVIDGIQVVTNCTMGNKKLRLRRGSSEIAARFEFQNGGQVTVKVNPATFDRLKNGLLAEESSPEDVRKLVEIVASMPEEELFIIEGK